METKEEGEKMNKAGIMVLSVVLVMSISVAVHGQELQMKEQGNIMVSGNDISNIEKDYKYLEREITELNNSADKELIMANSNRRNGIKSRGNINFENGKVFFCSEDLFFLADEIDNLEDIYKRNLIEALNKIGTYFKKDGTITYESDENEVNTEELYKSISIGSIRQGIISSQSVESVKQLQAMDKEQNLLFYKNEEAKNNGENLNFTKEDSGFPMYYKEADCNNLSAGSAAWVNGVLIKGNGEDNRISWQNGYNNGYSQGVADSISKANIVYTYHQHTEQGGACYGTISGMRPIRCGCNSFSYTESLPGYAGIPSCEFCYHYHAGKVCDLPRGYEEYSYIGLVCGKTEETIESATIIY